MSKAIVGETYDEKLKRAKDTCIIALKLPSDATSDTIVLEALIRFEQEEDIERQILYGDSNEEKLFHMSDSYNPITFVIKLIKNAWEKIKGL
jgi:hypothetical protein